MDVVTVLHIPSHYLACIPHTTCIRVHFIGYDLFKFHVKAVKLHMILKPQIYDLALRTFMRPVLDVRLLIAHGPV